jgi:hypothetical protein
VNSIITRYFFASLSVFQKIIGGVSIPCFFPLFEGQIMHVFGVVNGIEVHIVW